MSDIILKGKGVWYRDESGVMHPMSFPPRDSEHEKHTHFHINSLTGKHFKELHPDLIGKWPMEIAAGILARELMERGYKDESGARRKPASKSSALRLAKTMFNMATDDFNRTKRDSGDDFHVIPKPFNEEGVLHSEYKNNHYGAHQHKRVPTSERMTRTEDGKLVNNYARNEKHPTLGQHLESSALHIAKEFQDVAKKMGVETSIGAKQNVIEPQQITGGVTRRYTSNEKDPTSKDNTTYPRHYKDKHAELAGYGQISPMDVVSVLPGDFFNPSTKGNMSKKIMNQLMEMGYDQPTARSMARAPVNQLLYGRGKEGSETGLRLVMRNMAATIGINDNNDVNAIYRNHRDHFAPLIRGGDRGRNQAAIEIMAMLKTAEDLGIEPSQYTRQTPPASVVQGWRDVAAANGGKKIDMAALGSIDEAHSMRGKFTDNHEHLHDSFPDYLSGGSVAESRPIQPIMPEEELSPPTPIDTTQTPLAQEPPSGVIQPFQQTQFTMPSFGGDRLQMSNDDPMGVIATIMERVQMHDAGGSLITKYDPMNNYDMQKLGQNVGMSSIDVRAIAMSLGDWEVIAKSFNTTHDVVRAIKRSCGGALNG